MLSSMQQSSVMARAIALPGEYGAFRLPTVDAPRSSVASLKDQYTLTGNTGTPSGFSPHDTLLAYYGQPGRLAMIQTNWPTIVYYYLYMNNPKVSGPTQSWIIIPQPISGSEATTLDWPVLYGTAVGNEAPHGRTMATGRSRDGNFILMDKGDSVVTLGNTTWSSSAVGNLKFEVFRYASTDDEPTLVAEKTIDLDGGQLLHGTTLFTAAYAGYYKLVYTGAYLTSGTIASSNNAVSLQLLVAAATGTYSRWLQRSAIDLDPASNGDLNIAQNARVNAGSMLVTNTSAVINRQGTVLAARFRRTDVFNVSEANLALAAEKYTGDAAKGVYTFKEFTSYAEQFRTSGGINTGFWFDLDYHDFFHFVVISGGAEPNVFTLTFDTVMEFQTDVGRYAKATCSDDFSALVAARKMVNSNPHWFYENPSHMEAIYNFLRTVGTRSIGAARTYGPAAARAASILHPAGAPAYEALAQFLRLV